MNICWASPQPHVLFNPRHSTEDQERFSTLLKAAHPWSGHVWLSTSGSSGQKWVGLSKEALLASAQSVNNHLKSDQGDRWVNALPSFHVGGLAIWARAYLSGASVYDFREKYSSKWQGEDFYGYLKEMKGTLSALVPAQLHDIVTLGRPPPAHVRAIIIGGGALLSSLYEKAVALGWPILPSYGLTECGSQVATAPLERGGERQMPMLKLLPHIRARECEGCLYFSGPSLLSVYAYLEDQKVQFADPKINGWLRSEDRGTIQNGELRIGGRVDALFKVGGESVDLARLEHHLHTLQFQSAVKGDLALIALPDARLGHAIHLAFSSLNREELAPLIKQFQQSVLPFERIRNIYFLEQFPRSSLGKILKRELVSLIVAASACSGNHCSINEYGSNLSQS